MLRVFYHSSNSPPGRAVITWSYDWLNHVVHEPFFGFIAFKHYWIFRCTDINAFYICIINTQHKFVCAQKLTLSINFIPSFCCLCSKSTLQSFSHLAATTVLVFSCNYEFEERGIDIFTVHSCISWFVSSLYFYTKTEDLLLLTYC